MRSRLLSVYICLVVYGTLFPFVGWHVPTPGHWLFGAGLEHRIALADVLANIFFYLPVGFLFALGQRKRVIPLALLTALILSVGLETAQAFLHGRVSSWLDTVCNVLGAGTGIIIAQSLRWPYVAAKTNKRPWLRANHVTWLGMGALATWAVAQLVPFVPSLDVGNIKAGLKPLWYALQGQGTVNLWRCLVYVAATTLLTVTGASVLRIWRWGGVTALCLLAVLPLKVLVIGRQLSPEAFLGTLIGVTVGVIVWSVSRRMAVLVAVLLVPCYVTAEALQPGTTAAATHAFNWIPLRAQLVQPINGLANLADSVWPVLALACLCVKLGIRTLWPLLPVIALLLFGVEWAQRWIPGRYPGITPVMIGVATWVGAAVYVTRCSASAELNTR